MTFDTVKFCIALNLLRNYRRIDWKDVSLETGVDAATLSRLKAGKNPDADNLLRLCYWGNFNLLDFGSKEKLNG